MMPTADDTRVVLDLLREGKTDPELWTYAERSAVTRMHAYRDSAEPDPMDGAIEELKQLARSGNHDRVRLDCGTPQGWHALRRMIDLALNEAFRNGMRSEQERHVCPEASRVWVRIPGLDAPRPGAGGVIDSPFPGKGTILWPADRSGTWESAPQYDLRGDPNAVAVGRFKASLRKFLGVD